MQSVSQVAAMLDHRLTKNANKLRNTATMNRERNRSMEQITLIIPGTPTPKGRPRFTRTGRTYTDARTRAVEQAILTAWLTQVGTRPPHDGPIHARLQFVFPVPASWPKWKRELATSSEGRIPHTGRPDLDNLIKVIDGLNGRAWLDDSQLINIHARKDYGPEAVTRIYLTLHPAPSTLKGTRNE